MQDAKYNPTSIENQWYQTWSENHLFSPSLTPNKPTFSIQLPPPNITGTLHMGHAFNQTIMDGLVRYHRMKGADTCWIPGSDHAGIATQIVVERQLATQGIHRHDLGRETFLQKIWDWKEASGGTISEQIKRMGCSVDWSREYFTMDETRARIVNDVFVRLYQQGLIYRGKRLVNWDPVLGTAVSDLEVENTEENGLMWHIRYPLADNPEQGLIVATTRPETLLGDVAVAVNPEDARYAQWIGKKLRLPLTNRTIPVIADEYVEKDFGTGCVKITPAHDFNDYQVGQRHQLPLINIFDLQARVRFEAEVFTFDAQEQESFRLPESYAGLDRLAARKRIVADLTDQNLLLETKAHTLMTPRGDRTGSAIEPMLTNQWFVAMSAKPQYEECAEESPFYGMSLAEKAKYAVDSEQVRFVPENWVNTYNQWMNNIQDWCISRQLWWGHQIPAWYDENGKIYVAHTLEEAQTLSGSLNLRQEEDVLDTWFSSALVPFSTLGWPEQTPELTAFLPGNVLVTGYEIIFFWVARMIMMTTHFTGKVPFKDVYIHGMVRDHEGRKMSKSEGNVIDPVDLIDGIELAELLKKRTTGLRRPEKAPQVIKDTEKLFPEGIPVFGTDALRMTMASYASLGRSINFDFKRAEGYRNFCNKLWNATRFVLMNIEGHDCGQDESQPISLSFVDQWIISRLQQVVLACSEAFDSYRFDLLVQHLYEFIWNEYCDWYLELAKVQLQSADETILRGTRQTLVRVLEVILRLLHPLMPFITEELWQTVAPLANAKHSDYLISATWPEANQQRIDSASLQEMARLQDIVHTIRNLRAQMGLSLSLKAPLWIEKGHDLQAILPYLPLTARLSEVHETERLPENADAPIAISHGIRLMLKVEIDREAEIARLQKEAEKLQKQMDKLSAKLNKPGYIEKAPTHLVEKDRQDWAILTAKMTEIRAQQDKLSQ